MLKKLFLLTLVISTTMFNLYATEDTERIDLTIDKQTVTAKIVHAYIAYSHTIPA